MPTTNANKLKAVRFKDTSERMMTLGDLCTLVAGRVPLVIEVKSHFDGDRRLVARMAAAGKALCEAHRGATRKHLEVLKAAFPTARRD